QGINAPNGGDETGAGQFAVSDSGMLVYASGGIGPVLQQEVFWLDRSGGTSPFVGAAPGPYLHSRISPDGTKVVMSARRGASRLSDLWPYDTTRGVPTRLTFTGDNSSPVWSPDDKRIVFGGMQIINAEGGKPESLVNLQPGPTPSAWSAAAGIVYLQRTQAG